MIEEVDHEPDGGRRYQSQADSARNARYGMWLFLVYLAFYAGFVLLSAFRPEVMDAVPAAGVNLAIWYGFALIVAALVLALLYAWLCHKPRTPPGGEGRP